MGRCLGVVRDCLLMAWDVCERIVLAARATRPEPPPRDNIASTTNTVFATVGTRIIGRITDAISKGSDS